MEVFVSAPSLGFSNWMFPEDSAVRDVLTRFTQRQEDFYVVRNGRLSDLDEPLLHGAVYHLEPRLCGGKGGFGSMLRALGAQIEKTTNREACRDLSGRRLRDVNHEKEMAEWLKKQAEREAEKEQRRLERLQRKLREPKHQFSDPEYQQQCHDLSERLEDSVIKGLQASSGSQVKADDVLAKKRPNSDQIEQPQKKKKKMKTAACFWIGLDKLPSSEEEDDEEESMTEEAEPEQSSSSSDCSSPSADQNQPPEEQGAPETSRDQTVRPSEEQGAPETSRDKTIRPPEEQGAPETSRDQTVRPSEEQGAPETSRDKTIRPSEEQGAPETSRDKTIRPPEEQGAPETSRDQTVRPSEEQGAPETSRDQTVRPPEEQGAPETSRDQTVRPSEEQGAPDSGPSGRQQHLDLSSVSSVEQLEVLGLDVLKEELISRGLKCGGTLMERAARLFSIRGLTPDQIEPALLAKPGKTKRK